MKNLNKTKPLILLLLICVSCIEEESNRSLASINVVNAAIDVGPIKVNCFGHEIDYSKYGVTINYGANRVYSVPTDEPLPLTIISTGSESVLYNESIYPLAGGIYSMYLIGQSPNIESMLVRETNISPNNFDQNAVMVRFGNLSPNSSNVKVTISMTPSVVEFDDISYKEFSEFKSYSANEITSLVFQVRNASTNAIITSYSLFLGTGATSARYHSVTLILRGLIGDGSSIGVSRINNY